MKKKIIKTIGAFTMASIIGFANNVYGAGGASPGASNTPIFAGVFRSADRVLLEVEVPTAFAFVVNPDTNTANSAAAPGVSTPNAYVRGTTANPTIATVGSTNIYMTNRSAFQAGGTGNWVGTGVSVQGELTDDGGATFRYDRQLVATGATTTTRPAKTYGMRLIVTPTTGANTTHNFSVNAAGAGAVGTELDTPISLPAPVVNTADGKVVTDTDTPVALVVFVGGTNADYTTSELSSKVGTVTWKISRTP